MRRPAACGFALAIPVRAITLNGTRARQVPARPRAAMADHRGVGPGLDVLRLWMGIANGRRRLRHASTSAAPARTAIENLGDRGRTGRPADAPSADRIPMSRSRSGARASSGFATLKHASSRTRPMMHRDAGRDHGRSPLRRRKKMESAPRCRASRPSPPSRRPPPTRPCAWRSDAGRTSPSRARACRASRPRRVERVERVERQPHVRRIEARGPRERIGQHTRDCDVGVVETQRESCR